MFRSVVLSGMLALTTTAVSTTERTTHRNTSCRDVTGTLDANVTRINPTLHGIRIRGTGTSTGDLDGPVQLEVLKPFTGRYLKVEFTISTPSGDVVARGKTLALPTPASPDARLIDSDLDISGGSGRFDAASGNMNARGQADTKARALSLEYAGQVCTAT